MKTRRAAPAVENEPAATVAEPVATMPASVIAELRALLAQALVQDYLADHGDSVRRADAPPRKERA